MQPRSQGPLLLGISLSRHGGRVGEDPGNEVVQDVAHVGRINGMAALSGFSNKKNVWVFLRDQKKWL